MGLVVGLAALLTVWLSSRTGSAEDATEQRRIEASIEDLAQGLRSTSGSRALLQDLVGLLAKTLGVEYALIGELMGEDPERVQVLATRANGEDARQFEYELSGSPCEEVVCHGLRIYETGVQARFPEDVLLQEMGIEAYAGMPLYDPKGVAVGTLVALSSRPLEDTRLLRSVMRIFSIRASNELERLKREERLRMTRFAMDHARDAIFLVNEHGYFIDVNDTASRRLEYDRAELLSMRVSDIDVEFPADEWERRWGEHWTETLAQGSGVLTSTHRTKSGRLIPVEIGIAHLKYEGRDALFALARDITDRIRADDEREQLELELRHAQKMEALGTFAGGIAHDFNNLLTAIYGNVEVALADIGNTPAVKESLETIGGVAHQGEAVTQSLLMFAHKARTEKRAVDLLELVTDTARLLRRLLPASVQLVTDLSTDGALWVWADAAQLQQVLMNLTLNARHAMPEGGEVRVGLREELHPERPDLPGRAVLTVADNGCGMDPETQRRLFEPFFTTRVRGDGTGMGLAIVHGIVTDHEGRITVDSEPNRGSRFEVSLPVAVVEDTEETVVLTPRKAPAAGALEATVLVAEDNDFVRQLIVSALQSVGYEVTGVPDGEEALSFFTAHPETQLAILDLDMPKVSGASCLRELRQRRPELPVVLMTGNAALLGEARGQDDVPVLSKPFQTSTLVQLVHELLGSSPLPAEQRANAW